MWSRGHFHTEWGSAAPARSLRDMLGPALVSTAVATTAAGAVVISLVGFPAKEPGVASTSAPAAVVFRDALTLPASVTAEPTVTRQEDDAPIRPIEPQSRLAAVEATVPPAAAAASPTPGNQAAAPGPRHSPRKRAVGHRYYYGAFRPFGYAASGYRNHW
jgi:hypothetical protein